MLKISLWQILKGLVKALLRLGRLLSLYIYKQHMVQQSDTFKHHRSNAGACLQ